MNKFTVGSHWYDKGQVITIVIMGHDARGILTYAVKVSDMNVSNPTKYKLRLVSEQEIRANWPNLKPMN